MSMVCAITPEQLVAWFLFMKRKFTKEEIYKEFDRLDRLGCMVGDKEDIDDLLLRLKVAGKIEVTNDGRIVSKWIKAPEEIRGSIREVSSYIEKDVW